MSALRDHLADVLDVPETDDERERFRIDGPNTAEWALRKLARIEHQLAEDELVAQDEQERIDAWLRERSSAAERDASYFRSILTEWHREVLAEDPKKKTITLPAGVLKARKRPDTVDVVDFDALKDFAEGNGRLELLRVKVEPDKPAIKKAVIEAGEAVPGVVPVAGDVAFTVEVAR